MVGFYSVQITFGIDNKKDVLGSWSLAIGYDDELLSVYTPEMETGRWPRTEEADAGMIEIVLAQKEDTHKVGEIYNIDTFRCDKRFETMQAIRTGSG